MMAAKLFIVGLLCLTLTVEIDAANRPPEWVDDLKDKLERSGISEALQSGSEIGYLRARDPDGDEVTYSTNSARFRVDEKSGRVTLRDLLDAEEASQVSVTFTATDSEQNSIISKIVVRVIDVNDNPPQFTNAPYSFTVKEDAEVGDVVFSDISIKDIDSGVNSLLQLSCYNDPSNEEARRSCEKFSVREDKLSDGVYRGRIILKEAIDYEEKQNYILVLQAKDQGNPAKTTIVNVVIDILDVQDTPPSFLNVPLSLVVYENTPWGTSVGKLQARDQDEGNPSQLTLKIISDPKGFFQLGPTVASTPGVYSAEIQSSGKINREALEAGQYEFNVQAKELIEGVESSRDEHQVVTSVTVTVKDTNDSPPRFNKESYTVNVPEQLAANAKVPNLDIIVTDDDLENNAYFELRILDEDKRRMFTLSPASGISSAAVSMVVTDSRYMDYEQPDYRTHIVRILATETKTAEQLYSTATVTINLNDINDNSPRFLRTGYTASVRENRKPPYDIITVTAEDSDSGSFGEISYSLVGTLNEKFSINAVTGVVSLAQPLDYETNPVISLECRATDGGGRSTLVPFRVNVLDYNDLAPVFDSDQYYTFVGESSTRLSPNIVVHAVDDDSEVDVTYRIKSGNTPDGAFRIDRESGEFSLSRNVDYQETPNQRGFFEVIVEASDNARNPQYSTIPVIVNVRDENNHSPEFSNSRYYGTVKEVSPPGTSVVQVTAKDKDAGDNARIDYVLQSGSRDNFVVNYETGLVQVAPSADLDIERFGSSYRLIVHAVDRGSPDRTGTAEVFITVTDSNNKPPVFTQDVYLATILDSVEVGTDVKTVTAKDPDDGANIEYTIQTDSITANDQNGNPVTNTVPFNYKEAFTVGKESGIIKTSLPLDRKQAAEVSFVVIATDTNAPALSVQTGTATVIISIRSEDQGGITFPPPWSVDDPSYTITVPEEDPVGADHIILRLSATDPQTGNPIQSFREVRGSDPQDYFSVKTDTGEIYLNKRLDYDTNPPTKQISFQLEAFAAAPETRSAMATVVVNVQDINDNSPQFMQHQYIFTVKEDKVHPTKLGVVVATDRDSGRYGNITYSLSGQGVEMFYVDPVQGELSIAENATLNRELVPEFKLMIEAKDNAAGPGNSRSTALPLTITVEDVNDNPPKFTEPFYEKTLLETTGSQTSVIRVQATDSDSGSNGDVTYSIIDGDEGLFDIGTTTGVILTKQRLSDYARESPYDVKVLASDGGSPALSTQTIVRIFINDRETPRGKPRFIFPPVDGVNINIPEEVPPGWNYTKIQATDEDTGESGSLSYHFLDNGAHVQDVGPFHIDKTTGVITTTGRIDRETTPMYQLTIVVKDNGDPPQETIRTIFFNVTDINDNEPSFNCPQFNIAKPVVAHVKEEENPPLFVTQVQGCDADDMPNNNLYYFIISGNECPSETRYSAAPFWINITSGVILTQVPLDRERCANYKLTVEVSDLRNRSRFKRAVDNDRLIDVIVNVDDINDNGAKFAASGGRVLTGVLATAELYSELVRMQAIDVDADADIRYSLSDMIVFRRPDDSTEHVAKAFLIDAKSGVVSTNMASYLDYLDGVFEMWVTAMDDEHRDDVKLMIYVVRASQRLRFVFGMSPEKMRSKAVSSTFMRSMAGYLPNDTRLSADSLYYHVGEDAEVFDDRSDLCFHVVKDNKVMNPDIALKMFDKIEEKNTNLSELYHNNSMTDIDFCEVKVTTRWWSGYWYLWWILIAVALFIFVVACILICCYCCDCCHCCTRPTKHIMREPYVVLNPAVEPVLNTSGAAVTQTPSNFEWQEAEYKM